MNTNSHFHEPPCDSHPEFAIALMGASFSGLAIGARLASICFWLTCVI
jgi:hypothetical protein